MGRNPTSQPIPPSTCWQDAPPRSAQQNRRPRQAGYQGEALTQWKPGLQLVVRVAALVHQQAHPQQHCQAQQAASWRPIGNGCVHAGSEASASGALAGASGSSATGLGLILLLFP